MRRFLLIPVLFLCACAHHLPEVASIGVTTGDLLPGDKPTYKEDAPIPFAVKTEKEGVALSPYYPHGLLDVSGLPSGKVVLDPTSGLLIRVP